MGLISCKGQINIETLFQTDSFQSSKLLLSDQDSFSKNFTNDLTVNVYIEGYAKAKRWCLSEVQTTLPNINCVGGEGSDNGWSNSFPSTFTLSSGDGLKQLYLWITEEDGPIRTSPLKTNITLDTTPPTISLTSTAENISLSNYLAYQLNGGCVETFDITVKFNDLSFTTSCPDTNWS